MWGRKAARIRELEAELKEAREELVNVTVSVGPLVLPTVVMNMGLWHRVSFLVKASEHSVQMASASITISEPYFSGETLNLGYDGSASRGAGGQ